AGMNEGPTCVFILVEDTGQIQRLIRIFDRTPGFSVAGTARLNDLQFEPGGADVAVVQVSRGGLITEPLPANLPHLFLVPPGEAVVRAPTVNGAVLSSDANPAQIRAAAMAIAAGLRLLPAFGDKTHDQEGDFAFLEPLTDREITVLNLM